MESSNSIEVKGLGKRVADAGGELAILDGIEFTVRAGSAVAITGSSGSGKSTLLGLLAGLDVPSAGSVALAGHDLFELDEDARAKLRAEHVGFVFQSFQLLPNLTALENVMLPLELAGKPARAAAQAMLERVGLGHRLDHYPSELSGGEMQRAAIARSLAGRPSVLLADEPTGNLDSATGQGVLELLRDLNRERGLTMIMVTHDAHIAQQADRVVRLAEGRIEEWAPALT